MMLLLAAALLVQTIAPPVGGAESDVVVTARKLQEVDIRLKRRHGQLGCQYKGSSGDPALDAAACAVAIGCYEKAKGVADLKACVTSGMTALITPPAGQPGSSGTAASEKNP